jgi:hypothetical protein
MHTKLPVSQPPSFCFHSFDVDEPLLLPFPVHAVVVAFSCGICFWQQWWLLLAVGFVFDKICTALCTYIQCLSFCQLYSLPLLTWRRQLARRQGTDVVSLHAISSNSWIISYDFKWYKISVVFTTVFHRALLSCRWQWSWIVSSVRILAPQLCLRCWLQDIQSSLISIPV